MKKLHIIAIISMALAIGLGALGAHFLKTKINVNALDAYKTAVFYHIIHNLAIIIFTKDYSTQKDIKAPIITIAIGTLLFSGSIYALSLKAILTGVADISYILGPITPIGGMTLIIGWILLGYKKIRRLDY